MSAAVVKLTRAESSAIAAIDALAAEIKRTTGRHGLRGIEIQTGALDRLDGGTLSTAAGNVSISIVGRKGWATPGWRIPGAVRR